MRLTRVHVRFFKSFNFDYERRALENASRPDWEKIEGVWYPFVRLDVDPAVTAIVGANESGKSHLLDAIECLMGTRLIERSDFCRYSQLYSIETDELRLPDVGGTFVVTDEIEVEKLYNVGVECEVGGRFIFVRPGDGGPFIVVGDDSVELDRDGVATVESVLPKTLRFSTDVAIPDSVPISTLWGADVGILSDRVTRSRFLDMAEGVRVTEVNELTPHISRFFEFFRIPAPVEDSIEHRRRQNERQLARKLLVDVARVDPSIFKDLQAAISTGKEGDVSGIIGKINQSLSRHLNFARWWSQDADFALRVAPRERELVFTIQDRTGSEYSFGERSRGLTHFLAYFVQLKAHVRESGRAEILLMDEPDAYLSNSGQQDLLRVLENFAVPDDGIQRDQVIYVTHSPFLINKNAAHRIRVLDKGSQEEGTRVVKDVARTHYEPLRSSLGSYVAETTFIGGKNLIVEGVADQVLLAGMSNALRSRGGVTDRLFDLNEITIVPAGSADSIPYIAYLARGRDQTKPSCVALLDGDDDGRKAVEKIRRSEANRKPVLDQKFVVILDKWAESASETVKSSTRSGIVTEIEDLIPPRVAIMAARQYAMGVLGLDGSKAESLKENELKERLESSDRPLWDELKELFSESLDGERIEKVGFARAVVSYLSGLDSEENRPAGVPQLEDNFTELIGHLAYLLSSAEVEELEKRRNKRMGRIVSRFLDDFQDGVTRSMADSALREIEAALDDIASHDIYRQKIAAIRRDFNLKKDAMKPVENFSDYRDRLGDLTLQERLAGQQRDDD